MEKESLIIKTYQLVLGSVLLLVGILLLILFSAPVVYLGFVFLAGSVIYFAIVVYLNTKHLNNGAFKSRIRERMIRHQYRH
jgi:uncharacterized membrane protein